MHIAIVCNAKVPVAKYGGVERIVWWLAKALAERKHRLTLLVLPGSSCDFATVQFIDKQRPIHLQIPADADVVHFHSGTHPETDKPHLTTVHGNLFDAQTCHINSVFISANHAARANATAFVHNGLDFSDYGKPDFSLPRAGFHFLGDAAWKVKNLKGAIRIARMANEKIAVLGGRRVNLNQGVKINFSRNARFYGKVGGDVKNHLLNRSKGLLFPVLWHEPFGLAVVESLYFGCPVFATPFGSLPELVNKEVGFLSDSYEALGEAARHADQFNRLLCHQHAMEHFSVQRMTDQYLKAYETVMNGHTLNEAPPQITDKQEALLHMRP